MVFCFGCLKDFSIRGYSVHVSKSQNPACNGELEAMHDQNRADSPSAQKTGESDAIDNDEDWTEQTPTGNGEKKSLYQQG